MSDERDDDGILRALGENLRHRERLISGGEGPDELSRPLADDERDSVIDAAFARIDAPSEVVPMIAPTRRGRSTGVALTLALLAVAAMVLLWWGVPHSPQDPGLVASLPVFTISSLAAGNATDRAADPTPQRRIEVRPDDNLDLVLTPRTPFRGPLAVVIVARRSGDPPILTRPTEGIEVSPNGAVRLRGPLDRFVALAPGEWTLEFLLGAPQVLPTTVEELEASSGEAPWRTLSVHAKVVSPPR